jgi:microcystin-dependent protein
VHTHNIAAAEAANAQNWTSKQFGTGVTTDKIVDGAVTGAKGGVPLGAVFHFASTTAPAGYLACNGSVIPVFDPSNPGAVCENVPVWRLQDLRTFLGSSFGVVGKLPDLRGVFIRGLGQNATQTARTFVKSFSTATLNLLISTLETNDPRASTVSYTLEFYSDAAHLKKLSEQTVPVTQDTFATTAGQFCRVYANKGAASAALGAFQRESMQQHYHGVSDPEHTHGLSGGGISGSVVTSITQNMKYNNDRDGNGTYLKNIGVYTGTGLTYSQPSVVGATTGVAIARQPAEIAGATVDETRPVNAALLPCIKY